MTSITIRLGPRTINARVDAAGEVLIDDAAFAVTPAGPGLYVVDDGMQRWHVAVAGAGDTRWVSVDGQVAEVEIDTGRSRGGRRRSAGGGAMMAPMPATVVKVLVQAGQSVSEGEAVLVLEAMKMELPIRAPRAGVVAAVRCAPGDLVQPGVALVDLE
jgi:3-methylcrotonyl-CoA carboxylase alpha subunit